MKLKTDPLSEPLFPPLPSDKAEWYNFKAGTEEGDFKLQDTNHVITKLHLLFPINQITSILLWLLIHLFIYC